MQNGTLNCSDCFGTLTVNGLLLNGPAWCVTHMTALLDEADLRGSDRLISHVPGVRPKRRRRTMTRKDFPMAFTGLYDSSGTLQTDTAMQLILNIEECKAGLGIAEDAPAGTAGTVAAIWDRPDGSIWIADVHVTALRHTLWEAEPHVSIAVLSLELPSGRFVDSGSGP